MKRLSSISSFFMCADSIDVLMMVVGFLASVANGMVTPTKMFVLGRIMNNIGGALTTDSHVFVHNINRNVFILLYMACGAFLVAFLEGYCWTRTGERQATRLRAMYLKSLLSQEVGYFDLQVSSTAEVITTISNDIIVIQDTISEKVPNFVMNVTLFLASFVISFSLMWKLAVVALPFVLILVIPGLICGKVLTHLARKKRQEYNKAATIAEQVISSIRTVYSFVGEGKTMTEFSTALQRCVKLGLKEGLAKGLTMGSNGAIYAMWAVLSWYGSILVMYHGGKGGTVYSIGACISSGGRALGSAIPSLKNFSEAYTSGEHILGVIRRVSEIDPEDLKGEILENFSGEIKFRNLKFAYPSRPNDLILRDLSLEVPAGKMVALVGESGSGKSTIIALLERFYNPLDGEILLGGVDIRKLQVKWLRSQMGLVSQEPLLFATSIKENIIFGKEDATMEEIVAAAEVANAHHFISQLPQGYDTQVGERGVQMSGGQKQRIAIARAIIKAPRILLLDEATSALDTESERVVQEALDKAAVGRTTIVIAHRLSTIRNVDLIAVVKNGTVMEIGSHEELIQDKNGLYYSLVQLQSFEKKTQGATTTASRSFNLDLVDYRNHHSSSSRSKNSITSNKSSSARSVESKDDKGIVSADEDTLQVPSFRRLLLLNFPEWKKASVGCVSALLSGAVHPTYLMVMGGMISVYFLKDHNEIKSQIMKYSLSFASLSVFSFVINLIQYYNFAAMGEYLTKRVREKMLSNILTFEVGWFDKDGNSTGAVCSRLAKDASGVRSLVGDRMCLLVQTFSAVTVAYTMSLIIAWRLAVVIIVVQPLFIASFYTRRTVLKKISKKGIKAQDESSKLAMEAVSNVRTVIAFSSQDRILNMLDQAQEGSHKENIRQSWIAGICLALSQSILICTWAIEFWYGGKLVSHNYIKPKAFLQTFMILVGTGRVIADAGAMTTDLARGADAATTVFSILDQVTRIDPDNDDGCKPRELAGYIEIHDVDFAYPARSDIIVIKGLSLNIEAGKSTALVGQSGSGKSTIIGLIERFYDPVKGKVMIDGRDIKSYHLRSLRKHIGLVSQEPILFSGTIRENIEYGRQGASENIGEAEVIEAAKAANAHDFITSLRDGYETRCGDRGTQLSGGQKQRIAIARAILKNPALLLLDEATSALDGQSEAVVQEALESLMVGRTIVMVAHRLSTIKNCDLIVVLEKGKVVEQGTHSALLAKGPVGAYHSLVTLQRTL